MLHQIQKTQEAFEEATPKKSILSLSEVEQVFEDMMLAKMPEVEIAHDCIANENPYYKTIQFTTWAGCFIMHPLNHHLAQQQVPEIQFGQYYFQAVEQLNCILQFGYGNEVSMIFHF